jgi:hypothetical protein
MCALQHTRITSPDEALCRSRVRLDLSTSLLQPSEYLLKLGAISLETTIVHKTREREAGNKGGMPAQAKYIYMPLKNQLGSTERKRPKNLIISRRIRISQRSRNSKNLLAGSTREQIHISAGDNKTFGREL